MIVLDFLIKQTKLLPTLCEQSLHRGFHYTLNSNFKKFMYSLFNLPIAVSLPGSTLWCIVKVSYSIFYPTSYYPQRLKLIASNSPGDIKYVFAEICCLLRQALTILARMVFAFAPGLILAMYGLLADGGIYHSPFSLSKYAPGISCWSSQRSTYLIFVIPVFLINSLFVIHRHLSLRQSSIRINLNSPRHKLVILKIIIYRPHFLVN